jgi:type IV secretory system conjugative DNA transfer VirD4/TraG family protein
MQPAFDFEKSVFRFSSNGNVMPFSIRDSVTGIAVFGSTGSGKTSGPGAFIARHYLAEKFGGCVLTTKSSDRDDWVNYCREADRLDDLIILEPNGKHFFDFLGYEASHSKGHSYTQNIAETLKVVIRSSEQKNSGKSDDPFWENALDQVIFFSIELCLLAYERLSLQQLYDVALSAPQKDERPKSSQGKTAFIKAFELAQFSVQLQTNQFMDALSRENKESIKRPDNFERMVLAGVKDAARLKAVDQFFIETYRNLAEKTRSIVNLSWTGFLFSLMKEPIYSLFCKNASTFTPEDCLKGKVVLLNLPLKKYHKAGRDVQILFKYIWQKAMERRDTSKNTRPVFLFVDEAQNFLHEYDAEYLSTARSSRIANVFMSQNLPNYYAMMGGDIHKSEHRVKSMLGNLATKFFCCNTCTDTNNWASQLIGSGYTEKTSRNVSVSGEFSSSTNTSYEPEPMVRPEQFCHLRTGGPDNGMNVDTYVHRQGKLFDNGHNFKKVIFKQK